MYRHRLTVHKTDDSYSIPGIDMEDLDDRVRRCINRLGRYEDTGLSPSDVEALKIMEDYNGM